MKMMEDRFPTSPPAQQGSSLEPEPPWFPHQSTSSSRLSFISAAELPLASVAIRLLLLSRSLILSTKEISVQSRVQNIEVLLASPTIFRYELWPHPPAFLMQDDMMMMTSVASFLGRGLHHHISPYLRLVKAPKNLREGRQFPSIKKLILPKMPKMSKLHLCRFFRFRYFPHEKKIPSNQSLISCELCNGFFILQWPEFQKSLICVGVFCCSFRFPQPSFERQCVEIFLVVVKIMIACLYALVAKTLLLSSTRS